MKRFGVGVVLTALLVSAAVSQFTFHLIDNFESGSMRDVARWWLFGGLSREIVKNKAVKDNDLIAESCGQYSLRLAGRTREWYVGGMGCDLGLDATGFSRFQIDVYGYNAEGGKLIVEFFDDDNRNYQIEQDPKKDYLPVFDDKFAAEIAINGKGFTRVSIPFSAFKDVNPGVGNDRWDPSDDKGSGGLLKMQLVAIAANKVGAVDFGIDNLILTR